MPGLETNVVYAIEWLLGVLWMEVWRNTGKDDNGNKDFSLKFPSSIGEMK